jgi:hypothetical protein
MKKVFSITILVIALLAMSFSLVMAKNEKVNLEGEITAVDEVTPTITVTTADSEDFIIHFSPDYEFTFTQADLGTFVHVKAEYQEDGPLLALWVKPVEEGDDEDEDGKDESAYCSGEKETAHPVIIVLANQFDKEVNELMGYFCDGFGIGQIYLALQTEKVTGEEYGSLLALREEGQGWGEIWKDLGYQGKPKDKDKTPLGQEKDKTPPGHDKDKTPPGQDKDKEKDKDKTPPGQAKDKNKEKKPKKNK